MVNSTLQLLRKLNYGIAVISGIVLLLCVFFVLLDIILRQMNASLGGTDEISGYVMAIVTAWGMSFAMLELAHVRIDVIRAMVNQIGRTVFDLFSMFTLAITISIVALKSYPVLEKSLINSSTANTALETPLWAVQLPWLAGWVWFACSAWIMFVCALVLVFQGKRKEAESMIGIQAEGEL